ncbi:hypothetical protein PR048_030144, partial [Dryococelus australis]
MLLSGLALSVGYHALSSVHTKTDTDTHTQTLVSHPSPLSVLSADALAAPRQLPHLIQMATTKSATSPADGIFIMSSALAQKLLYKLGCTKLNGGMVTPVQATSGSQIMRNFLFPSPLSWEAERDFMWFTCKHCPLLESVGPEQTPQLLDLCRATIGSSTGLSNISVASGSIPSAFGGCAATPLFDSVRRAETSSGARLSEKLVALSGDLSEPGLGLSAEDRELLCSEVTMVFHLAASIRFNEDINTALKNNLFITQEVTQFANCITNVKRGFVNERSVRGRKRKYCERRNHRSAVICFGATRYLLRHCPRDHPSVVLVSIRPSVRRHSYSLLTVRPGEFSMSATRTELYLHAKCLQTLNNACAIRDNCLPKCVTQVDPDKCGPHTLKKKNVLRAFEVSPTASKRKIDCRMGVGRQALPELLEDVPLAVRRTMEIFRTSALSYRTFVRFHCQQLNCKRNANSVACLRSNVRVVGRRYYICKRVQQHMDGHKEDIRWTRRQRLLTLLSFTKRALVYVSTAYSNCIHNEVQEIVYAYRNELSSIYPKALSLDTNDTESNDTYNERKQQAKQVIKFENSKHSVFSSARLVSANSLEMDIIVAASSFFDESLWNARGRSQLHVRLWVVIIITHAHLADKTHPNLFTHSISLSTVYLIQNAHFFKSQICISRFLKRWPNTYTVTKAMAEMAVEDNCKTMSAAILRPSVDACCYFSIFERTGVSDMDNLHCPRNENFLVRVAEKASCILAIVLTPPVARGHLTPREHFAAPAVESREMRKEQGRKWEIPENARFPRERKRRNDSAGNRSWVTGFSHVGIVPDDAVGLQVFSAISRFIQTLLHTQLHHAHRLKTSLFRAAQISSLSHPTCQSPARMDVHYLCSNQQSYVTLRDVINMSTLSFDRIFPPSYQQNCDFLICFNEVMSSLKEPVPGWVDSFNGPARFIVSIGMGFLHVLPTGDGIHCDIVPVDMVVNGIIAAAWDVSRCKPRNSPKVYNFVLGETNPLVWDFLLFQCVDCIRRFPSISTKWYPFLLTCHTGIIFFLLDFLLHLVPSFMLDLPHIFRTGKQSTVGMLEQGETGDPRGNRQPAASSGTIPTCENPCAAPAGDLTRFALVGGEESNHYTTAAPGTPTRRDDARRSPDIWFRHGEIKWRSFLRNYVLGIKRYLLKEADETLPYCEKRLRRAYSSLVGSGYASPHFSEAGIVDNVVKGPKRSSKDAARKDPPLTLAWHSSRRVQAEPTSTSWKESHTDCRQKQTETRFLMYGICCSRPVLYSFA